MVRKGKVALASYVLGIQDLGVVRRSHPLDILTQLSSSLSPDVKYDSEVSLDLRIRQEMAGTLSKKI
jgi:hypothetical protein